MNSYHNLFLKQAVWDEKIPAIYQTFMNSHFGKESCGTNLYRLKMTHMIWNEYVKDTTNFTSVADSAKKLLQPELNAQRNCVMMLLNNLASPESLSIDCNEKILSQVLCRINNEINSFDEEIEIQINRNCLSFQLLKNSSCLLFLWSDQNVDITTRCNAQGMNNFRISKIENLLSILLATNIAVSPIISLNDKNRTLMDQISFDMILRKYEYVTKSRSSNTHKGYLICEKEVLEIPVGITFFVYKSGLLISSLLLCDGIIDCPNMDTSDEQFCQCNYSEVNLTSKHCKEVSQGNRIKYSELYYMTLGACHQYYNWKYDHEVSPTKSYNQTCMCKTGSTVDEILTDDLYGDCSLAEDEPILTSLLMSHVVTSCADSNQYHAYRDIQNAATFLTFVTINLTHVVIYYHVEMGHI